MTHFKVDESTIIAPYRAALHIVRMQMHVRLAYQEWHFQTCNFRPFVDKRNKHSIISLITALFSWI